MFFQALYTGGTIANRLLIHCTPFVLFHPFRIKMVLFAMIARLNDGLPLSATTDHDPSQAVLLSKKYAKILSKKAAAFPDRCSLFTGSHWL